MYLCCNTNGTMVMLYHIGTYTEMAILPFGTRVRTMVVFEIMLDLYVHVYK